MQLLYMVLWADRFVHENKSISFYQPSPTGLFADFVCGVGGGGAGKQPWGRQMPFRTLRLLEVPPLLPSPSSGGVLDLLGYPRTSPVTDSRDLGVDGRYRGLSMGQRLWTGKGELRG